MKPTVRDRHFTQPRLNPLQEVGVMKRHVRTGRQYGCRLNPLQEVGVMKPWPWKAPPLLAWRGHLRTVAHKRLLDHVQHAHSM